MKHLILVLSGTLFLSNTLTGRAQPAASQQHCPVPSVPDDLKVKAGSDKAPVDAVLAVVNAALKCYEDNRGAGTADALPPLQQAQFDFKTTRDFTAGVTFTFLIFKFGATRDSQTTDDVAFTYTRPKQLPLAKAKKPPTPLADALVAKMQAAAKVFKSGSKLSTSAGDLPVTKATITLAFGVTWDANASGAVPASVITIGPSIDVKRNDVQTVTLTFSTAPSQ